MSSGLVSLPRMLDIIALRFSFDTISVIGPSLNFQAGCKELTFQLIN
jgi:hypothetical protein